jgi:hypothetical protein
MLVSEQSYRGDGDMTEDYAHIEDGRFEAKRERVAAMLDRWETERQTERDARERVSA